MTVSGSGLFHSFGLDQFFQYIKAYRRNVPMPGSTDDYLQQLVDGQNDIKEKLESVKLNIEKDYEILKNELKVCLEKHDERIHALDARLSIVEKVKKKSGGSPQTNNHDKQRKGKWLQLENGSQIWVPKRRISSLKRVCKISKKNLTYDTYVMRILK